MAEPAEPRPAIALPDADVMFAYGTGYYASTVVRLLSEERERSAKILEDSAARLLARQRTNAWDRRLAAVLREHAERVRGRQVLQR